VPDAPPATRGSSLTVLSPHRDDAALSVAFALARAVRAGVAVRIVVPFPRSNYAPQAGLAARDVETVSQLRAAEDARFVRRLGARATLVDFGLGDALLRPGFATEADFITRRAFRAEDVAEYSALAARLAALAASSFQLVPLGLGDHIDHRLAAAAAETAWPLETRVYYEDLPYAAGLGPEPIRDAVRARDPTLVPLCVPGDRHAKFAALSEYRSQLGAGAIAAVLQYAGRYEGAERLWVRPAACEALGRLLGVER
jgi:LmbE family N-acetylglucosaminyl deacetylase